MENQIEVQKFVDHYLLRQHHQHHHHSHNQCQACQALPQHGCRPLSRDDIDLLQLMNPRTTPEQYLTSIGRLYQKEETLRTRQQRNQPMQLTLYSRRLFRSDQQLEAMSHKQQFQADQNDQHHLVRLRNECYLGLGRKLIEKKEKKSIVELRKANYHTRQYLLPHARTEVIRLQSEAANAGNHHFYLLANANARGVHFQPQNLPMGLEMHLPPVKFREIICTINEIIQRTVYQHKRKELSNKGINPLYFYICLSLILLLTLLLANSLRIGSAIVQMTCLVGSLVLMLFILMASCHQFHKDSNYTPLLQQISEAIKEYLNYLNSRPGAILAWNAPNHLYWIEISLKLT